MSEGREFPPKPRIIEFKGEQGKVQRVNLNNLVAVFAKIQVHNEEFSLGAFALLTKELMSHIREEGEEPMSVHSLSAEKDKRDALSETIGIIHADSFSPIGISFDTASETGVTIITRDEKITETEIKFGLQNPDLFISFLDALCGTKELHQSKITELISKIGYDLSLQIYKHYAGLNEDERVPLFMHRLEEIVALYEDLGIKAQDNEMRGSVDRLEVLKDYSRYAEQGILQEYIAAKSKSLLVTPGEKAFGPAEWQSDSTPESLQYKWKEAIFVLMELKRNPKAKYFFDEVKANLQRCIGIARKDIESQVDDSRGTNDEKRTILQRINQELQDV